MICAIDPSTKKLAFVVGKPTTGASPVFFGELPTGHGPDDLTLFQRWVAGLRAVGVTHLYYELPYMGKNVTSFQRLAEVRALVEATAKAAGIVFHGVNASQWQAACLSVGRGGASQAREIIKPLAMRYAADVIGVAPATQDLADAICIYRYAAQVIWPTVKAGAV